MAEADDRNGMLAAYLRERDEECPGCGYNLRDLTGTRCPECNQELVLRVGLAEPRMAWFVTGVVGISMGLGFSLMVSIWAGLVFMRRGGGGGPRFQEIVPLVVGSVVGALLMCWWVRGRRRLSGGTAEKRWCWVAGMTAAALVCPMWFFAMVR